MKDAQSMLSGKNSIIGKVFNGSKFVMKIVAKVNNLTKTLMNHSGERR